MTTHSPLFPTAGSTSDPKRPQCQACILDPGNMGLEAVLNTPAIQSLLEDFSKLTGAVVAILDLQGKVLVSVGWQDICTKFHRVQPISAQNCTESDLFLAGHVKRGEYVAYHCKNGLWDVVTPLYIGDRHLGNMYTGQFFYDDETVDSAAFEARAACCGFDRKAYLEALERVPRLSRAQVQTLMDFLVKLTELVSGITYTQLRANALLQEQERAAQALRASEERFRSLVEASPVAKYFCRLEPDGTLVLIGANPSADALIGIHHALLLGKPLEALLPDLLGANLLEVFAQVARGERPVHAFEMPYEDGRGIRHFDVRVFRTGPSMIAIDLQDISERRKAMGEIQELTERFKLAADSAGIGVWDWDPTHNKLIWDQNMFALYGVHPEDFQGAYEAWIHGLHPDDVARGHEEIQLALSDEKPFNTEFRVVWPSGEIRTLRAFARVTRDEAGRPLRMTGINFDITDRKKAEIQIERLGNLLQASQAIARVGGWEIDLVANSLYWTDETYEIHDTSPAEYTPTVESAIAFYAPESLPRIQAAVATAIQDGTPFDLELELITAKGRSIWVHTTSRSIRENGKTVKVLGAFRDITEQRRAEQENRELMAQMSQAQKMDSLGNLAGGVAHDMNNVLSAILGLASANLETQPQGTAPRQAFETIIKAAERGGKMVKSLLSFARRTAAEERQLDMNAILREEVGLLERTTLAKVQIVQDLTAGLHPILGDANALAHAVMNLCVNAVDAMTESGVLRLQTRNVDDHWIEVTVADNGAGMTQEILSRAMDPFFTTKAQGKGTGLGLSMVYSTVKAHQGQMDIQSEPGRGTRVRMRFPGCPTEIQIQASQNKTGPSTHQEKRLVMVVDDDELIQSSMEVILDALGHHMAMARNGEEALGMLETGLRPDLVILDMNMPGLGGSGTLPRLRILHPDLPVLLATGRADQKALDLIANHPRTTLLPKPFSLQDLREKLQETF